MISYRNILIYNAIIYDGDYDSVLNASCRVDDPDPRLVEKVVGELKCKVLTMVDPDYPLYLKKHTRAPLVLFYYGDISLINDEHINSNLGIVGTRSPTDYGLMNTKKIVYEVAKDCVIVSGMADGIDGQAHRAAIEAGAKTVAVLGSGIDNPYPAVNLKLYSDIIESGGLVISEYPNMSPPTGIHFPIRNRLIAMFSKSLLVTEAYGTMSGTSITVTFALGMGKDVMCIPYPAEEINSFCNHLLYEGAKFVRDGRDVLIDMNLEPIKII